MPWGLCATIQFFTCLFSTTLLAQTELASPSLTSPNSTAATLLPTPTSKPDYASILDIKIEEVCLGKPGLLPSGFTTPPYIQIAPFFGQHFNKHSDFHRGANLVDPVRLDQHERLSEKESHPGHYVFKNLTVQVRLLDVFDKLSGTSAFYPKKDEVTGESSIEFYGVNLAVKTGLNQMVASRWAFNGDESARLGITPTPLLEPDPVTSDLTKIDALWPTTGILVNNSRRFVTVNESFFGAYTHKNYDDRPTCNRSPFIVYSVKKSPGW